MLGGLQPGGVDQLMEDTQFPPTQEVPASDGSVQDPLSSQAIAQAASSGAAIHAEPAIGQAIEPVAKRSRPSDDGVSAEARQANAATILVQEILGKHARKKCWDT